MKFTLPTLIFALMQTMALAQNLRNQEMHHPNQEMHHSPSNPGTVKVHSFSASDNGDQQSGKRNKQKGSIPSDNVKAVPRKKGNENSNSNVNVIEDGLEEDHLCIVFDDPLAIVASNTATTDEACRLNLCNDGCCRFHTNLLVCDTKNDLSHQSCVCNERTNNDHLENMATGNEATGGDNGGIDGGFQIDVLPASCVDGSPFQALNLDFPNCFNASDCDGVLKNDHVTCCKKNYCFCGAYDIFDEECIA
jgi:hypothetical protein